MNTFTDRLLTLIAVMLSLLLPQLAQAAEYYVSPSGSSLWSQCTNSTTPCSWQTAMANAVADDTVFFRGGTYSVEASCSGSWEYVAMKPAHSGTAGHYITFTALRGEKPVVTPCTASPVSPAFGARDVDYIIWDGFSGTTLGNTGGTEVWYFVYWNSNNSIVRNMDFGGSNNTTMKNNGAIRFERCTNSEAYNNTIHDMTGNDTAINTAGIWVFSSTSIRIHNNTIFNNAGGVYQKVAPIIGTEIYNNYFYNISQRGVSLMATPPGDYAAKIHHNVFYRNAKIAVDILTGGTDHQHDFQIYNNTICDSGTGIEVGDSALNNQVWNNIIYGTGGLFMRYYFGTSLPSYSDNNQFYGTGSWRNGYSTTYSSIEAWKAATTSLESNSVIADPQFVNLGGKNSLDYKRRSYPANGKGNSVMGAFITGKEHIGHIPPAVNLK
jgi:parallel beta helix pectate lyase-like protein